MLTKCTHPSVFILSHTFYRCIKSLIHSLNVWVQLTQLCIHSLNVWVYNLHSYTLTECLGIRLTECLGIHSLNVWVYDSLNVVNNTDQKDGIRI